MQEESSNGESSFEFVDKKVDGAPPTSSSSLPPQPQDTDGGVKGLLSNIAPPSALPSFVPMPQTTTSPTSSTATTTGQLFHQPKFSPAIPASKAQMGSGEQSTEVSSTPNQSGLFGWVKGAVGSTNVLVSKVAEKAMSSVDTMITTLDPQMKDFLSPGAPVELVVASDKEIKISPVREAFQQIFGSQKITVKGLGVEAQQMAAQPVGFEAGLQAAWRRVDAVRDLHPTGPIVAVENFIVELSSDKWFDLGALVLSDAENRIVVESFTQMTPIPSSIVTLAQEDTPSDYAFASTGLAITIGSLMASNLHVHHSEWHHALTGVSRRDMILLTAKSMANIYKNSVQ